MRCPFCGEQETKVIDSRLIAEGDQVRRRRECQRCYERFTTFESAELVLPKIVKSDGSREHFCERKLRDGIQRALEKRPVSVESIEASLHRIQASLRAKGEREVSSRLIGECVMDELKGLDEVAYVRFASVYRSFKDVSDFQKVIATIQKSECLKSDVLASEQEIKHKAELKMPESSQVSTPSRFSVEQDELTSES